jgi:hypothetical protein
MKGADTLHQNSANLVDKTICIKAQGTGKDLRKRGSLFCAMNRKLNYYHHLF